MGWTMHFYSNIITNYGSKLKPSDTLDDFPGHFHDGQLRKLQRRVREWRTIMARKLVYACIDGKEKHY